MASCKNILHAETSDKITECKTSDGAKTCMPMASVRPETSSDTIVEVKATKRETEDGTSSRNIDSEKNAKPLPPPLENVSSAQELPSKMGAIKTPTSAPPVTPGLLNRRKFKERKIGHRRVDEEGQITFKKIYTSQIQGSISLGISHAVGRLASKPERDLLMEDFTIVETTTFPREGSNITPAHHYSDFKFKSYAPVAFRYFRDLFGILPSDFLLSLCNNEMIELTNPGASGSIFYLTEDDEFILKTIQHKEAEFLQKLLPGYYMNLNFNPRTLLPKFFGLYCYQCGGKNVRLVVMNNLLPTSCRLHEKYDLKGSSYKRKASKSERKKSSPTYKDLDFLERHPEGIFLEPDTYKALTNTIHRDCRVLQSFKIMDYSLLVGIHNIDLVKKEKMEEKRKEEEDGFGKASDESESASPIQASSARSDTCLVRSKSINRQRLAAFSTAMESIQAEVEAVEQDYDVPPGGIPAKNAKGEHLLLFLGIIDILQSYRLKKRMEHAWKSMLHDGDTVSVHRPSFYAERFEKFMAKTVFKKMPASAGQHRKFKTVVSSVLALKHSPSKRKGVSQKHDPSTTAESGISHSHLPKISSESECTQEETIAASVPCSSKYPDVYSTKLSCEITNTSQVSTNDKEKSRANTDPVPPKMMLKTKSIGKTATSSLEVRSLSHGNIQTESVHDCASEASSTSTSGLSSTLHTVSWTPPHSVEGSTPTHTEGTPSFTESSSSGDAACPTTPVKSINKSSDSLPPLGETQILQDSEMIKKV